MPAEFILGLAYHDRNLLHIYVDCTFLNIIQNMNELMLKNIKHVYLTMFPYSFSHVFHVVH